MMTLLATIAVFGALAATASASVLSNLQRNIASENGIREVSVWVETGGGSYLSGICSSHLWYNGSTHYYGYNQILSYAGDYWSGGNGWNIKTVSYSNVGCNPNTFSYVYPF